MLHECEETLKRTRLTGREILKGEEKRTDCYTVLEKRRIKEGQLEGKEGAELKSCN